MEKESSSVERFVSQKPLPQETTEQSYSLRPEKFSDFPGQKRARNNLEVYVEAAKTRGQAMDHVLLHGPPGLGKTSLARIISHELAVPFFQTSGPAIDKAGDLAGILAGLEAKSVLFIDEIHRLSAPVEEVLYSAMEDFFIDVIVGQGPTARTVKMPVQPFTLIGATTRLSLLTSPLVSRFGIQERFEFYDEASLAKIIRRSSKLFHMDISEDGTLSLSKRSRGTPRIANRLLKRIRDFSDVHGEETITGARVDHALNAMEIDQLGLDPLDRNILNMIYTRYDGGPVGVETLAHSVGEDKTTIEDVYEPFLVHSGLLIRGPRGRELTEKGLKHIETFQKNTGLRTPLNNDSGLI